MIHTSHRGSDLRSGEVVHHIDRCQSILPIQGATAKVNKITYKTVECRIGLYAQWVQKNPPLIWDRHGLRYHPIWRISPARHLNAMNVKRYCVSRLPSRLHSHSAPLPVFSCSGSLKGAEDCGTTSAHRFGLLCSLYVVLGYLSNKTGTFI